MAATRDITVRMFLERCRVHGIEPTGAFTLLRIPKGSLFTQTPGLRPPARVSVPTFRFQASARLSPILTRRSLLAELLVAKDAQDKDAQKAVWRADAFYAAAGGGPFEGADPHIKWLRVGAVEMTLVLPDAVAAEVLSLIRPILLARSSERMLLKGTTGG